MTSSSVLPVTLTYQQKEDYGPPNQEDHKEHHNGNRGDRLLRLLLLAAAVHDLFFFTAPV